MRERKVIRYYCDFCTVAKFTRPAMVRHERGCTANPARVCGMCDMAEQVNELPALLVVFDGYTETVDFTSDEAKRAHDADFAERFAKLRELSRGCPACILAVLRQRKVHAGHDVFDWKTQSQTWLNDYSRHEPEGYY